MILRQTIFFLLFSVISSQTLTAQAYKPMLVANNEWQVTICGISGCLTDIYITQDDTVVNGETYSILDGYHYISRHFLLREDVNTRKVYLEFIQNGRPLGEVLLYDFALQVGDSLMINNPISPFPPNAGYFTLDSIVSRTLFDGEDYRHFYLTPSDTTLASAKGALWIEGIGSLVLINTPGGEANINSAGHLSCMFKNGNLIYSNTDSIASCNEFYFLIEKESLVTEKSLQVYPTTIETFVSIKSDNTIKSLQLSTIDGQLLARFFPKKQNEYRLDFNKYKTGIYILDVIDANKNSFHQLLIKQ
jgi:hypothetical protein